MKKILFVSVFLVAGATTAVAQSMENYDTAVSKFERFYNVLKTDSVFGMFSDRIKGLMPLDKTTEMLNKLTVQLGDMKSYELSKKEGQLVYYKVEFDKAELSLVMSLDKDNKLGAFRFMPYTRPEDTTSGKKEGSNLALKTTDGNIYGTLTVPGKWKKIPVVLLIAGSGPTDRDGNSSMGLTPNTYRMIADSLVNEGIACARYDKRGVAESAGAVKNEESTTFGNMVNDAVGFIKILKEDARFSKVIVLGHSEGSLIGMLAAQKEKVNAFISVSGIAAKADKIIEKQIASQSKELAGKATIILDSLDKGYKVRNIDPSLEELFHPSVQPYLISWLKYEPRTEIKKLSIPVLIIQGTTDLNVGVDEAEGLKKAYPAATLKIIPGMNHMLKPAPKDRMKNLETYKNPDLPLSPALVSDIVSFVNSVK